MPSRTWPASFPDMRSISPSRALALAAVLTVLAQAVLAQAVLAQAQSTAYPYQDSTLSVDARVADLLARMSLEEKVAQMRIFHANKGVERGADGELDLSDDVVARLANGIAGIKNPGEHLPPAQAARLNNELQRYVVEHNRWGIPALFVTEAYNGVDAAGSTKFGRPMTQAATWNPALVRAAWDVVGREARLRGMHMCHSPEADLIRDPRFGRMSEAFGEDTHLVSEMVVAAVRGVQGDYAGLGAGTHIGAVVKHFAGYGQVLGGTNFAAVEVSPRTLEDELFPPFEAAVRRGRALGVMASHGDLNGVASHANPWLLTEVLRERWGFEGYTVSDANDIGRLHYFMGVAETPEDAALLGLRAGMDVDLYADDAYALLPQLAREDPGIVPLIDRSVARVLRTKFVLGLFDDPYVDAARVASGYRTDEALALARHVDEEAIVLLQNRGDVLPLAAGATRPLRLGVFGPSLGDSTAAQLTRVLGDRAELTVEKVWDLTDGQHAVPLQTPNSVALAGVERVLAKAARQDVLLLYLGGDTHTAKEGFFRNALGDRASIDPLGPQDELVRRVRALGKPVIVVLKHRRTLSIPAFAEHADAILDCWDLSEFGDEAVARILVGEVSPSGKTPVTTPRTLGQLPFHYSGKAINNRKGYLFLDEGPLYPFGHGLSYTTFRYDSVRLSAKRMSTTGELSVSVRVTNTGTRPGKEVVQLYVTDEIGSVVRPAKELKAFRKIGLAPGETREVRFAITPAMLAMTGLDMRRRVEPGWFTVQVGGSSADGVTARFRVE